MKATVILKPLEYNLETTGEKWRQGEKINGQIKIKNNSQDVAHLAVLKIVLSSGNYKKVKAKDKKAWERLSEVPLAENISINPSEEKVYKWDFQLSEDCRITDKDGSLYLRFLNEDDDLPAGNIEVNILPKIVINQFLEVFDNFLRFKIGTMKYSKGMVEVKLTPPASRELSHIDGLILRMSEVGGNLKLEYNFNMRVLEMMGTTMTAEKKSKQFEQTLTAKQYYVYGSPDQDFIRNSIGSILNEIKPKMML
ncbi:MAG: hypothetical protein K2Q18_01700 [Bdellovibrionales bacterium]|nr:hypothetical protein [Bdellovibrionales bacterium]